MTIYKVGDRVRINDYANVLPEDERYLGTIAIVKEVQDEPAWVWLIVDDVDDPLMLSPDEIHALTGA